MNYKEQLQNLSKKYTQNFAPGGVVGNPGFGTKVTRQYKDENNREIVEFSDGKRMYTDSPEYQKLYSEGLLYGESPDKITYPQANANPEMERYKRIESMYPFSEFAESYFQGQSGAIARATGQSQDNLENMPEDYKTRYDEWINQKWAREVFSSNPQNEGETRGEYLNRIAQGMNPQVQKALYDNLPSSQQTTLWQDGDRGLRFAVEGLPGAGTAEEIISRDSSLSDYEKQLKLQNLRENPMMGRIEGNAEMFAPVSVLPKLVQSTYRPNYSPIDALSGRKNDAGVIEDELTDPTNYIGLGLGLNLSNNLSRVSKIGDRYSEALNIIQKEGAPTLKATVKGYTEGLKKGFTEPREIDRFIPAESSLTRPEVKQLREIQSLSSLSMDSNVDQITLYNKYLKSSLDDTKLKHITGKTRSEIQDSLKYMMSEKKEVFDLDTDSALNDGNFLPDPPREITIPSNTPLQGDALVAQNERLNRILREAGITMNRNGDFMNMNSLDYSVREKFLDTSEKGASDAIRLRNIFSKRKDLSSFVDIKPKDNESATSLLPSLFKEREFGSDDITKKMMGAFSEVKNANKGYYNASNSISDSSAPLYYTNASRLGSEKNIDFVIDGFTQLNGYGYLNKAGVEKNKILDFMNNHISNLDFKGKKLPKAYLDEYGEIQIPNLLIKKFLRGGQFLKKFQQGGEVKNELQETKDWWNRYINSPKYLERLQKEFPDSSPEQVQRELEARKLNLSKTYPIVGEGHFKGQEMKNVLGYITSPELDEKQYSSSFTSRIKNFTEDYIAPSSRPVYIRNGEDSGTYNHETSHSVDESGRRIPLKTVANLVNKVRGVEPVEIVGENENSRYLQKSIDENTVKSLGNADNYYPIDNDFDRNNGSLYPDIKWKIGNDPVEYAPRFGYRGSPTEVIARLQPLREELYRKGIHDSATEDISKETLMNYIDQTFQNENEPVSDHLKDLWNEVKGNREQGVENLQWMLNNIAQRDGKNKKPVVAQKGGSIGNSLKDQLNALAQKFQK